MYLFLSVMAFSNPKILAKAAEPSITKSGSIHVQTNLQFKLLQNKDSGEDSIFYLCTK